MKRLPVVFSYDVMCFLRAQAAEEFNPEATELAGFPVFGNAVLVSNYGSILYGNSQKYIIKVCPFLPLTMI